MLVLSRRKNDKIVFPNLGITVEVLRMQGNVVRLGVDAAKDVDVLRHELAGKDATSPRSVEAARTRRHDLRNRLNTIQLALHLAGRQAETGMHAQSQETMLKAVGQLELLEQELGGGPKGASKPAQEATAVGESRRDRSSADMLRRALVVEDNSHERELLAGCLRMSGYAVDAVEDGLSAMTYLSENERPDCVLLDMRMPRLNGSKTVSAIRGNPKFQGLKLFAVSGGDPTEFDVPSGTRGVDRWFHKPVDPQSLIEELDRDLAPVT